MKIDGTTDELIDLLKSYAGRNVHAVIEFEDVVTEPGVEPDAKNRLLLSADEVAVVLGMTDRKHPRDAVKYLHRTKQLVGVRVSGRIRWRIGDVEEFSRNLRL